jgi:glucans biosynthesis protein C
VKRKSASRIEYLDFARAVLFSLGMLLHSAWLLKGSSPLLADLHDFIHSFRMESFFLIAGFFSGLLLKTGTPENYLRNRFLRLSVPLIIWGTLFNVFLNCALRNNWHNLTFLETSAYWLNEEWLGHLWFIGTLLSYVVILYAACRLMPNIAEWVRRPLWSLPVLIFFIVGLHRGFFLLTQHVLDVKSWSFVVTNGDQVLDFLPFFIAGYILFHRQEVLDRLVSYFPLNVACVILFGVSAPFLHSYWGDQVLQLWRVVYSLQACAVLFWISKRFFNKPNRAIASLSDASYTIYLVHWPLMAITYRLVGPIHSVPVFFFVLVVTTSLLSYAAHHYLVSRSRLALLLLNGRFTPSQSESASQPWMNFDSRANRGTSIPA